MVGMDLRYGGRTLVVTAYVNTDEEPGAVYERVEAAVRGPKMAMALVTVSVTPAEEIASLWRAPGDLHVLRRSNAHDHFLHQHG